MDGRRPAPASAAAAAATVRGAPSANAAAPLPPEEFPLLQPGEFLEASFFVKLFLSSDIIAAVLLFWGKITATKRPILHDTLQSPLVLQTE